MPPHKKRPWESDAGGWPDACMVRNAVVAAIKLARRRRARDNTFMP
jgi:hypothetical protein